MVFKINIGIVIVIILIAIVIGLIIAGLRFIINVKLAEIKAKRQWKEKKGILGVIDVENKEFKEDIK